MDILLKIEIIGIGKKILLVAIGLDCSLQLRDRFLILLAEV